MIPNKAPKSCATRGVLTLFAVIFGLNSSFGEEITDWTNWRGPGAAGSLAQGVYPQEFNAEKFTWRVELPGKGSSTPIVSKEKIYLTAPSDGKDCVLCFDASGKEIWRTVFGQEDPGKHANGSGSNASPVTDGQTIFAYFKSGTFAALGLDGSVLWKKDIVAEYGKEQMFWDHGSSPVLTRNHAVLVRMHAGQSWLAAFNKSDGQLAWKIDRTYQTPVENDQCYTTPVVMEYQGQEAILVWGAEHITIHSANDGKLLWSCTDFNPDDNRLWPAIASPVVVDDMVIVAFGRNDRGNPLLYGVRLSGSGDVTQTNHIWKRTDVGTFVPTPSVRENQLIVLGDQGEVEALDVHTGKTLWKSQLPKNRNKFYASPLWAGDSIYAAREDGVVFVATYTDGQFKVVAENDMGESVIGSPVPMGNGLLLRGEHHLYSITHPANDIQ
jgi:outer membrane protein assembly factor BamB